MKKCKKMTREIGVKKNNTFLGEGNGKFE